MKQLIHSKALELGFDVCRFTSSMPPETGLAFDRAIEEGRHAEMAWLARNANKRKDPELVLPGIRSIVLLGISYALPEDVEAKGRSRTRAATDPGVAGHNNGGSTGDSVRATGLVARYARHADYHDVLAPRLRELAQWMDAMGGEGTRSLWYVDTGPILERDLGQRAGLGFVGKHTNLISSELGNWFLIAEVLTTLELEPDESGKNHCGKCTRCLDACPTGALPAPFVLDARRCISYLTIENRGSIPLEFREAIGQRIFGCDDCLAACPWNRFAREGSILKEHRKPELDTPDLVRWLDLDDAEFRFMFAGTPLLRTKRRGLRRNVCVALGNAGDATALPALERAAQDPDEMVAEHAQWAIASIKKA